MEYGFAFFPGQGAQAPGMGKDLYENSQAAKLVFEEASEGAGLDVKKLCFDSDKETLSRTENSQIAIFTHSMAALAALTEAGVSYRTAGENIAYGQSTPQQVMNAWMNSSGHRANILNANYTTIGVGYTVINGTAYWAQLFTA